MKPAGTKRLLVVDDEASHRTMLAAVLGAEGYEVVEAGSGEDALRTLEKEGFGRFDLVLLDIRMAGRSGLEVLEQIRRREAGLPVVMMTAYASVETAVEALKKGAGDYLTKPLDTTELKMTIARVIEHRLLREENRELRARLRKDFDFGGLTAASPSMGAVVDVLRRVAPTEATLLILGESGTGKEVVANGVHENSPRSDGPFVAVNCAAIPETLLESELFGFEKGAFTGAVAGRSGKIAAADGGTLFLDEVAEMPPALQAKILRFLQDRKIQPLGSSRSRSVDVRILAATNRDLETEVKEGRFREDLFYRLNVVSLKLPPLRERREDIPLLAAHFLETFSLKHRRQIRGMTAEAAEALLRHSWPGNVRELENAVERAVVLARGDLLSPEDLFPGGGPEEGEERGGDALSPGLTLREAETEIIRRALERAGGNKTLAAKRLGITRQTLINRLKESGG